eukprot:35234-Alexandrium_andersonii.AAC.1
MTDAEPRTPLPHRGRCSLGACVTHKTASPARLRCMRAGRWPHPAGSCPPASLALELVSLLSA